MVSYGEYIDIIRGIYIGIIQGIYWYHTENVVVLYGIWGIIRGIERVT